uniref:Ubiquitin-like protease family profile domain-containing protein n=1 Tax=Parascaris equorum TaxID=6256 RepID=A0A914S2W1_PAREQ
MLHFRNYLGEEMVDKKQTRFDLTGWKLVTRDDIPQQMNGSDCGMFTCKFAEFAARRAHISFTQEHMPYFRRRMMCAQMSEDDVEDISFAGPCSAERIAKKPLGNG